MPRITSFRLALTSGDAYSGVRGSAGHLSGVLGAVPAPDGIMNPVPQSGVAANLGLRSGVCANAPAPTPQSGVGTNRGLRSGVRSIPLSGVAAPLPALAAQSCMILAAASAPSRLSAMSLSTWALGRRIRSRTGPPSEAVESGDGGAVAAEDLIVDNCKNIYFAGYETTAVTAAWGMMLLALHPEWQARVRDEVRQACAGAPDFTSSLQKMKKVGM